MSETNEKIYKTMGFAGGLNIAIGVIEIVMGLVLGILTILTGASVLKSKKKILF